MDTFLIESGRLRNLAPIFLFLPLISIESKVTRKSNALKGLQRFATKLAFTVT